MFKRIIKTSFFSLGSRGFLTLTNLVIMYAVSHGLGNKKLGIYSISTFLYYLFSFLTSFELTTYFSKEVAHLRERADVLKKRVGEVATTFILGLGLSLVLLLVLLLTYGKIEKNIILISALGGVIFGLEKNLTGVLLGQEKMQVEFLAQLLAFLLVAVPSFCYAARLDIMGIYMLRVAASLLSIPLRIYYAHIGGLFRQKIRLLYHSKKDVAFFAATGFAIFIQYHIDLYILSFLIPMEQQGSYFVALRIFSSFCLLAEISSLALTPYISRVFRNKEGDTWGEKAAFDAFYSKILINAMVLGALAAVTLFLTRDLWAKIFAEGKANIPMTKDYLFYFSFFLFFRFVSFYAGDVLTATRYQNLRFYILLASATLMIGLEILLGKLFSIYGIICSRAVIELSLFATYLMVIAHIRAKTKLVKI
jgi:O-antigen/teichoic acid export membrane protein